MQLFTHLWYGIWPLWGEREQARHGMEHNNISWTKLAKATMDIKLSEWVKTLITIRRKQSIFMDFHWACSIALFQRFHINRKWYDEEWKMWKINFVSGELSERRMGSRSNFFCFSTKWVASSSSWSFGHSPIVLSNSPPRLRLISDLHTGKASLAFAFSLNFIMKNNMFERDTFSLHVVVLLKQHVV